MILLCLHKSPACNYQDSDLTLVWDYPASKGPFDLPRKVNLPRKIEGSSARRVVWEERWVDCRSMKWFYFVVEETNNAFKESLVTLQAKLTR